MMITAATTTMKMKLDQIKEAALALEGMRRALLVEQESESPNGYTIGTLLSGVGVISRHILDKADEMERMVV